MARVAGKNGQVTTDDGVILAVKSWTLDIDCDALDATGMDSLGQRTYIAGLKGWKGTIEGNWDSADDPYVVGTGHFVPGSVLATLTLHTSTVTPNIQFYTLSAGPPAGSALVTRFSATTVVDGEVTWTVEFIGCGELTWPVAAV